MRILLIITRGEIGGAQISVLNLARALKHKGHHVTVGLNDENFLHESLKIAGIPSISFKWLRRTVNPFYNIFFSKELLNYLRKEPYDIVHFNSSNALFGAIGAKLSGMSPRTVYTHHGLSFLDENYETPFVLKYFYRFIMRYLLKSIDSHVFVCNKNYKRALDMNLVSCGAVIYNGIDNDNLFFYSSQNARTFLENIINYKIENKFIIGSVGRLAYPKNFEFLINIFPELLNMNSKICCLIIGSGPEYQRYNKYISAKNLGKYMYLVGSLEEAYKYFKAFDIFVLPSIYEGFSITLIEALSAGIPILTSDVGGNAELLNYSYDQIFRLNDEIDFINKFNRIMTNPELRQSIMRKNKKLSSRYSSAKMGNKYLEIYQDLITSS